jgi:hypothetical protein
MSNSTRTLPARVANREELRRSGGYGVHVNRRFEPKGGRQGARRAAIREQVA